MNAPTEPETADRDALSLSELKRNVGRFFFAEEVAYGPAAARIMVAAPMLYEAVCRWPHARELYSTDGAPAAVWNSYGLPNALPELPGWAAVGLFSLYVFALVTALLGWKARTSCALAAAGCFYFCSLDSLGSLTKYTVLATHLLALLSLADCGAVWSVDASAARRAAAARGERWEPRRSPAWPRRLIQLLIGCVYFGAAFTKLHMQDFFNGDQMTYWMVTNVNRVHPLGPFMAENPVMLQIGAYATCLWEITFILMAWRGWGRRIWLTMGVGFHLMTTFALGLYLFPVISWAAYWAFLSDRDVAAFGARWAAFRASRPRLANLAPKFGAPPAPHPFVARWGYLLAAPAIVLVGMGAEHRLDPYQKRGPDGPLPLRRVDPALVRAMTAPHRPPRVRDMVWDFDLGRRLVGENLLGRDEAFGRGENLLAQAWLSPPHDDVVLECALCYADEGGGADGGGGRGPVVARQQAALSRDQSRYAFSWSLDESLEPGRYRMTLLVDGVRAADEDFTLTVE